MSATESQAVPVYREQNFYVPTFKVKLRGRELPDDVVYDVVQVSYKDNLEEVDSFEISINNWDAANRSFKYIDEDTFDPGKEIELYMGYHGKSPLSLMIKGEITSLRPNFPATGQPTLAITGLNLLHRLRKKQETCVYKDSTPSRIAGQIADRLGLKICTNPTATAQEQPIPYLFQDNEYDILFLWERARKIGYDLFVVEQATGQCQAGQLYFGPSTEVRRTTYQLSFNKSLVDFQPELATHRQVGKVRVQGWDAKKKEKIEYTATREDLKTSGLGTEGRQEAVEQSFGDREEVITDIPVNSVDDAKKLAISALANIAKDLVTGRGTCIGLPDLRAGSVVMIDGMGQRFSGRYFVTATTHTINDSGYTTQFDCRREEIKGK
ncbi:MAG TPA: hypothetical protein VEY11_14555 [Pyrinomonadaceae bacterium]|nr:hypothetical protein [Pyrinomonadaceae bacterium]